MLHVRLPSPPGLANAPAAFAVLLMWTVSMSEYVGKSAAQTVTERRAFRDMHGLCASALAATTAAMADEQRNQW